MPENVITITPQGVTTNSQNVGSSVAQVQTGTQTWHDPVDNPQLCIYTQNGNNKPWWNVFGNVRNGGPHQGVDLFAIPGTSVYACVDGVVKHAEFHTGYGNLVVIRANSPDFVRSLYREYNLQYPQYHELLQGPGWSDQGNIFFHYAHLSYMAVHVGDHVAAGSIIGRSGTTGIHNPAQTKDPHVHFEISCSGSFGGAFGGLHTRVHPGRYMHLKMPNELSASESYIQADTHNFWWNTGALGPNDKHV